MRKIIDSSVLQSEKLRDYLSKPQNMAVLTDYVAMEAYKENDGQSIYERMAVLATRPRQVVILKSTLAICGLRGRAAGLQRRMIDLDQTRDFAEYCDELQRARSGDQRYRRALREHGQEAVRHLERVLADAGQMARTIDLIAGTYSMNDIRALRSGAEITDRMLARTHQNLQIIVSGLFEDHPKVHQLPPTRELGNTYIFRFALCTYVWALRWIAVGGTGKTKPENLRNDMIDTSFVVYGTFFDGVLTGDAKAKELFGELQWWLSALRDFLRRSGS
jgi:hypothetical protein